MRYHLPLTPGPILIEQGIEHGAHVYSPWRPPVLSPWWGEQRLQYPPVFVWQIRPLPLPRCFLLRHLYVLLSSRQYANYLGIRDFRQLEFSDSL